MWEARYRDGEYLAEKGAFLPQLDELDLDFSQALELLGANSGKLLDIGTGLGGQAIRYAHLGFEVTATDVSLTSVNIAEKKAAEAKANPGSLTFVADNILTSALQGPFDVITDRGCYALLQGRMQEDYCRNIHRLLSPKGLFLLKMDAKKIERINPLITFFHVVKSWDTHYHGKQKRGPEAHFFILTPLPVACG